MVLLLLFTDLIGTIFHALIAPDVRREVLGCSALSLAALGRIKKDRIQIPGLLSVIGCSRLQCDSSWQQAPSELEKDSPPIWLSAFCSRHHTCAIW